FLAPLSSRSPDPPRPTLFPYTTLFRSVQPGRGHLPGTLRRCGRRKRGGTAYAMFHGDSLAQSVRTAPKSADTGTRCDARAPLRRSEEHTSELQSLRHLVCRLLLEKKKK